MKLNFCWLISFFLLGCHSAPRPCVLTLLVPPPAVLPTERRASVWTDDQVAPYAVGRYVDPRDRNVVHEAHTLYRREQSCRPNLTPPSGLVVPAPDTAATALTNATIFWRDALTADLNQQRAVSLRVIEQSQVLQQQVQKFTGQAQAVREALEESLRLRVQVEDLTNRLEQLRLRETAAPRTNAPGQP